ncbi:MAG: hypothetical protein ACFFAJ_18730, partial [Candidatus Hodarchaeota archaeon]
INFKKSKQIYCIVKMSDEDINSQIKRKQNEITKLEETTIKKEAYIKNRTNEEFDPKIIQLESEIKAEQIKLDEVNKKIEQWTSKKKELQTIIKDLKKKHDNLKKEKNKYLSSQLKAIVKEKNAKIKAIKEEIKELEKELMAVEIQ